MAFPPADDFVVILPADAALDNDAKQRLADYLEAALPGFGFDVLNGGAEATGLQIVPLNVSDDDDIPEPDRRTLPDIATITTITEAIWTFMHSGGPRPM